VDRRLRFGILIAAVLLVAGMAVDLLRASSSPPPEITGTDIHGKPWSLSAQKGKGPVLVSFFATW
jgi:hypothetical protein